MVAYQVHREVVKVEWDMNMKEIIYCKVLYKW